jgi:hypothetical protein
VAWARFPDTLDAAVAAAYSWADWTPAMANDENPLAFVGAEPGACHKIALTLVVTA